MVEFQKHDLSYIHILLILVSENKLQSAKHYDSIISAEISDFVMHSLAYEIVTFTMMHNLCGELNLIASCMKDGMYQKHYPKPFQENTKENHDGFPIYRR